LKLKKKNRLNYMNRKVMLFTGFLMVLTVAFAGLMPAYAQSGMKDKLGVDFSDSEFGIVVDLNVDTGEFLEGDLHPNVQVLHDYVNGASNPEVAADADTDFDQQFYLAYNNVSGVETAYMALDHIKGQLVLDATSIGGGYYYFGSYDGTAPFQTLLQHYMDGDSHVFAKNTFRAFVAYTADDVDPAIDPTDNTYVGYPIVEQNVLTHLNNALTGHGLSSMGSYDATPIHGENTFGMHYENMFVLFQDQSVDTAENGIDSVLRSLVRFHGLDTVNLGGSIAAAALFEYVDFTYNIVDRSNATHTIVDVVTEYDLGPVNVLMTRDDQTLFDTLSGGLINGINTTNSFRTNSYLVQFDLGTWNTIPYGLDISIPALSVYTGEAAQARISTGALQNQAAGFGISVVTSTNVWKQGGDPALGDDSETHTDASDLEINMDSFTTSFVGKATYTLHDDSGDTVEDVIVSVFSMSDLHELLDIHSLFNGYFKAQSNMAKGFVTKMVKDIYNPLVTNPGDVGLHAEKTDYATFVQMPKWSGKEVTQDPTYSVVSIIGSGTDSSDTSASDTIATSSQTTSALPGFEALFLILAAIPIFIVKKRK
jgi:hypothetical protein